MTVDKPPDMFDRDWEWAQLQRFVEDDKPGASLGIVSGRRRQGKTFLLEAITEKARGLYFVATEGVPQRETLNQLASKVGQRLGSTGTLRYDDWSQALEALLRLGEERAVPVVIDEFPYLVSEAKALPSVIQNALSPRDPLRRSSQSRLLLCGSSIAFMGNLLKGNAPLRGRASLELVVPTFDFRLAARFWGFTDHRLAALMYFVVGGTPAYRTEYVRYDSPRDIEDFDRWVLEHPLSPSSPLFREVRWLLAEEPSIRDRGLYHTVLAAVAEGNATRGGIASRLERPASDISHHLTILQDAGFLVADRDAFRKNRSHYRITEPLVRFYHALMQPYWDLLERAAPDRTAALWRSLQPTFLSQVAGPVFERMCRVWAENMAAEATFGGQVLQSLSGLVNDPRQQTSHDVDVAVFGLDRQLLSIGEVKWGETMGIGHLQRLQHIAGLLEQRSGQRPGVLAFYSGAGFTPELHGAAAASGGAVQLVGLDRLYTRN